MLLKPLSPARQRVFAALLALASLASAAGAAVAQPATIQPGSVEERLHSSSGRQTDLQIARTRPTQRDVAARVRDERSGWTYQQWDDYARSLRGQ
jgi:hypothetical protein